MAKFASLNDKSEYVRHRIQVALYTAREKRKLRAASAGEAAVPENALALNGEPLTLGGEYLTLGE